MLIAHNGASDTLYGELFRFVVHQLFVYLLGQYLASMHALNSKPPCLPYSAVPNRPNVSVTFLNKCQNRLTNNNFTRIKFLQSLSTSQCGQRVFHTFFCKSLGTRSQHKFAFFVLFFLVQNSIMGISVFLSLIQYLLKMSYKSRIVLLNLIFHEGHLKVQQVLSNEESENPIRNVCVC